MRPAAGRLAPTVALLALIFAVAGCGTAPPEPGEQPAVTPGLSVPEPVETWELPPSAFAGIFAEAETLLRNADWMSAGVLLDSLPEELLSSHDRVYRDYLQARILWQRGDLEGSDRALDSAARGTNAALQRKVDNFRRYRLELAGDYLQSAQLTARMAAEAGEPEAGAALRRLLWRDLQRVDDAGLAAAGGSGDTEWQGWLELARASRSDSVTGLRRELQAWLELHPEHPAADPLPGGLSLLLEPLPAPQKVALLLPLSGQLAPAAQAIRDGYLAAYFGARAAGDLVPGVEVYDSTRYESALAAYSEAVAAGAELVIGPLAREAVEELGRMSLRPVPVLALNRAREATDQSGSALVQLSLALEDEAVQLARAAFGAGARRAVLLRPAGGWGDRMEQSLRESWSGLGGSVAASGAFASAEQYAESITRALSITDSEARAGALRTALNLPLEFFPRRRQDVDAVFLLARNPAQARALKPLLDFYYAGDLPVYALSSVHRGIPDPADADLNGIRLVDLPWLLGSNPAARVAIAAGDTGSDAFTRLNALGADAFLIQQRFRQLGAGPDALLRGDTGLLWMNPRLELVRESRLATFDGGVLRPL